MILKKADILNQVVTSYDQTKTTIQGKVTQKTIDGQSVLGSPLTQWFDVFTDSSSQTLSNVFYVSNVINSNIVRIFILTNESAGTAGMILYNFNISTGLKTYVGRILFSLPDVGATTHTYKGLYVNDVGTTGWKIFLVSQGSVTINGGLFVINSVDLTDFIPVPSSTITYPTGNNQKAVYFLQDPSNIGVNQLNITSVGMVSDNSNIYVHNGTSATHQYYVYNATTNPTYSATSSLSISAATDTVTDTGHTYNNNDPVYLTNLSGGTGLTNNTIYFVRNSIAGVSYQLSTTSGGAAINVTLDGTATIGRAFGTTGSNWNYKTGNLPALTGTLLSNDSEDYAQPTSGSLSGFNCIALATNSNLYLGKISEITPGATAWPSLTTANLLGATNEVTAPTAAFCNWEPETERFIYVSNTSTFYAKPLVNNIINLTFGGINTSYYESTMLDTYEFGAATIAGTDAKHGWVFLSSTTIGQRGLIACAFGSDDIFDTSYIVTKVMNTPDSQLKVITDWEKLYDFTNVVSKYYRTSGFGTITGGWTDLAEQEDYSAISTGAQIQFKLSSSVAGALSSNPAQIYEVLIGLESNFEIVENFEYDHDNSSNNTPSRTSFRLKQAFTTSVPTLYFRAYDLSSVLIVNHNTSANSGQFEYSTNNGTSWLPLGAIPNTVGTLIRYTFTSPPGVSIRPVIKLS